MKKALMVVSILSIGIVAALELLYNQSLLFVAFIGLMFLMHGFGHGGHGHSSSSSHNDTAEKESRVEEEHPSHEGN